MRRSGGRLRADGWLRIGAWLACLGLLAACTTQPVRQAPPVASEQARQLQQQREAALRMDASWSLQGRVALANGEDGGSGRIDWQQAGQRYAVSLSAPITRQSWRLSGGAGRVVLEGLEGGPRFGADPARLLLRNTGWRIPVVALASWVRGAPSEALGQARLQFGSDGRLLRIEQGGWTIEYRDWRLPPKPVTAAATNGTSTDPVAHGPGVALPHWLQATRGDARVRLVVDEWGPGATLP